ncbi:MAG: hypothetical protein LC785_07360 [Acidobacteria bacterium]|nr:hypothetical protein [Acidobacteriota bacterium]MCA1641754.1 hypothetical protein [Acidobacteriota bacterium]
MRPPERSIDRQGQKFISDLVEVPRRENLSEIRVAGKELHATQNAPRELPPAPQTALVRLEPSAAAALTAPLEARLDAVELAIASASRRFSRERLVYMIAIAFLVGLTVVTALQAIFMPIKSASGVAQTSPKSDAASASGGATLADAARATKAATPATRGQPGAAANETARAASPQPAGAAKKAEVPAKRAQAAAQSAQSAVPQKDARKTAGTSSARGGYVVNVLMEVKDGRVAAARVLNPRPGAGAYEALALRMARQRRYPDNFTGGDTWKIRVKP